MDRRNGQVQTSPTSLAGLIAEALTPGAGHSQALARQGVGMPGSTSRRRLWELSERHHCVLLGATFDKDDLRRLFRACGFADWQRASDYELHCTAVCRAKTRNELSRAIHRLLDARYRAAVSRSAAARDREALLVLWRQGVAEGEAVAAYWAAITHPACDPEADDLLAREMHMIAHAEFASRRATQRRVRALEAELNELRNRLTRANEVAETLRAEGARLREEVQAARFEARRAAEETERLRSAGPNAADARRRASELEQALARARSEVQLLRRALRESERRAASTTAPATPAPLRPDAAPVAVTEEACALPELAGRRVLCIGGKTSLAARYRVLVEEAGGSFAHHDGGIEHHLGRLPAMLGAADLVICLAGDCSHAAYRLAKRLCKLRGKPCALAGGSGVAAVARCLAMLSGKVGRLESAGANGAGSADCLATVISAGPEKPRPDRKVWATGSAA